MAPRAYELPRETRLLISCLPHSSRKKNVLSGLHVPRPETAKDWDEVPSEDKNCV